VDAVGCHRLFSGLIGVFVFDILRTATGGIQICIGCNAHLQPSLAKGPGLNKLKD